MSTYNVQIPMVSTTSLLGFQHRVIGIGGNLSTGVPQARGIVAARVDSGQDISMVIEGRSKFQAGGTIAAHKRVTVTSGGFITQAASGDRTVGFNEYQAVTSGSFGDGVFDFVAGGSMTTSEG